MKLVLDDGTKIPVSFIDNTRANHDLGSVEVTVWLTVGLKVGAKTFKKLHDEIVPPGGPVGFIIQKETK